MRLMERSRELIPETWWVTSKGSIRYTWRGWRWWSSESDDRWRASTTSRL